MVLASFCEVCPICENENVHDDYDVTNGYIIRCAECGEQIFLCDVCMHAADNKDQYCDWHIARQNGKWEQGKCFRGTTFRRK